MKYVIVIPDGCADEPQPALGGLTPLQAAKIPAIDALAAAGVVGRANHVPASLPAGSDVANLSLLGYDPLRHFTGRAPLEAAAQSIRLGPNDCAIRCNLVTIEDQQMRDFTAGHISTDEARQPVGHRGRAPFGRRPLGIHARRQLSESADLSWRRRAAAVHRRHAGHAATRSDRQIGAGGLSARAGKRPAQSTDERQHRAVSRSSGQSGSAAARQIAGHQHLAVGAGTDAGHPAVLPMFTASTER